LSYASAKNLYIHDYRNRVKQQKSGITLITNHAFCVKRFFYTYHRLGRESVTRISRTAPSAATRALSGPSLHHPGYPSQ